MRYQFAPPDWRADWKLSDEPLYQPIWIEPERRKVSIIDGHHPGYRTKVPIAPGRSIEFHSGRMVFVASPTGQGAKRGTCLNRAQISQDPK
jgi:hypothetical protein